MPIKYWPKISAYLFCLLILSGAGPVFAIEDGFSAANETEGKYFNLYFAPGVEAPDIAQQLNIGAQDRILAGEEKKEEGLFYGAGLTDNVDTLFLRVSNILDMHLYSFKGNIKVCRDRQELNRIYNNLFDKDASSVSFYVYSLNTIYITADNFRREILGHEVAHAIISHYFVVQPPVKIQEVLAGYVEFQLRRNGQ